MWLVVLISPQLDLSVGKGQNCFLRNLDEIVTAKVNMFCNIGHSEMPSSIPKSTHSLLKIVNILAFEN